MVVYNIYVKINLTNTMFIQGQSLKSNITSTLLLVINAHVCEKKIFAYMIVCWTLLCLIIIVELGGRASSCKSRSEYDVYQ